jgi:N-acetylneuraminic acid mutarotase
MKTYVHKTIQLQNTTTLSVQNAIKGSPLWRGLLLIPFVLGCFALSPAAQAVLPPPDGGYSGQNTAEGDDAHFSLNAPASGLIWSFTGSLNTARFDHTATLLPNGMVLVAAGFTGMSTPSAAAELYDPSSRTWTATGSLNTARFDHTTTLLPNGMVLVAGGYDNSNPRRFNYLASAELYDPATGTWTGTGSLNTARYVHTATLLPNGIVLVAGGSGSHGTLASAEQSRRHR